VKTVKLCVKTTRYFNGRNYRNYYVTIPFRIAEELAIQPGDRLSIEQKGRSIILTRAQNTPIVSGSL
jgi:AbrB family looped-hinge helix DNA binding protein